MRDITYFIDIKNIYARYKKLKTILDEKITVKTERESLIILNDVVTIYGRNKSNQDET